MSAKESQKSAHVLAIPFPAEDHLNPFLSFAHLLSSHDLSITLLTTQLHSPPLQHFLTQSQSQSQRLQILTLHLPLPPSPETNNSLAYSFRLLENPLTHWLQLQSATSCPVTCILSDFHLGWTQNLAFKAKIPRIVFYASSAITVCVENSLWTHLPHLGVKSDDEPFRVPDLPVELSLTRKQIPTSARMFEKFDPVSEFMRENQLLNTKSRGAVVNTFDDLELIHINSLHETTAMPVWAVGPILPELTPDDQIRGVHRWLDERDPRSVLFVFVEDASVEVLRDLARVLESVDTFFVWVVNSPEIPDGFDERIGDRGHIITARISLQKLVILSHPCIWGFLMRSGWTATLASISMGVPIITWPAEGDDFCNSVLVAELHKIGVGLFEGEEGAVNRAEIKSAVERVMGGGEEAKRAEELGDLARKAVGEEGSSTQSLKAFIDEIRKLSSAEAPTEEEFPPTDERGRG